eukprot:TRINITY_DN5551_c0_g2_i1.p3 TRINITY_DN5551_c0_g2~~TRINITY_DN5551_c0_g2_i1.p3  ORF type:complete len:240 (+),score=36.28 TRINITY_DN5551_c0_g2_i1:1018-1737(+)
MGKASAINKRYLWGSKDEKTVAPGQRNDDFSIGEELKGMMITKEDITTTTKSFFKPTLIWCITGSILCWAYSIGIITMHGTGIASLVAAIAMSTVGPSIATSIGTWRGSIAAVDNLMLRQRYLIRVMIGSNLASRDIDITELKHVLTKIDGNTPRVIKIILRIFSYFFLNDIATALDRIHKSPSNNMSFSEMFSPFIEEMIAPKLADLKFRYTIGLLGTGLLLATLVSNIASKGFFFWS